MSADRLLCISVIDAALTILRYRTMYPDLSVPEAIRHLRFGPVHRALLDYEGAVELAELTGWDAFYVADNRQEELRETIKAVALRTKPFWARMTVYGRDRVSMLLDDDQLQCLRYAGVLETPPDDGCQLWWDDLSATFRAFAAERMQEIGREGERWTLAHERARLISIGLSDHAPKWVSIEDNTAGYDVLSYDLGESGVVFPIEIEVKTSSSATARLIVTRNEWREASRKKEGYRFYVWKFADKQLTVVQVSELEPHIPADSGAGQWLEVEIRLTDVPPEPG